VRHIEFALLVLLFALPACHRNKGKAVSSGPAAHVPGTLHTDEVLSAWRQAGLDPGSFTKVEPPPNSAAYCEHGQVRGVDTLLCEYASEEALLRGITQVKEGWERVDAHTGVVLRKKQTTMVTVDRERREPSGTTINQMAKVFGSLQARDPS